MNQEENDILRKLEPFRSNDSFKVPDDYFETLAAKIDERINVKDNTKKITLYTRLKPWISIAAIFLIGFLIFKLGFNEKSGSISLTSVNEYPILNESLLTELTDMEIMEFIAFDPEIDIDELDEDLLMGLSIDEIESLVVF